MIKYVKGSHKFFLLLCLSLICSAFSSSNKLSASFLTNEDGLLNNAVHSIAQDHLGFLWFGTDEGLSRYDGYGFLNLTHHSQDTHSLSNNVVHSIFEDSHHQLWVATRSGLNRLINPQQGFVRYFASVDDTNSLSDSEVFSIYEDSDSNLWIGTGDGALNFYDREEDQFSRYIRSDKKSELRSIIEDKHGRLVLGYGARGQEQGEGGICIFDKQSRHYLPTPSDESTQNLVVMKLIVDQDNNLWIATYNRGFFQYDLEHDRLMAFDVSPNIEKQVPTKLINNILEVGDSAIWLATEGRGILSFDKDDHSFSTINSLNNGSNLSNNSFLNIFEDKAGVFWIGSVNQGVLKLDKYKSRDGFIRFPSDDIVQNSTTPPVVISKFLIANKEVELGGKNSPLQQHISITDKLTLTHFHKAFSFEFVALNYTDPQKNEYAYTLEGFDEDWNYVGKQRNATYTNLNPGEYTFRVKASNNAGRWNEEGPFVHITILPPWWKSGWAYACYTLILVGLIVAVWQTVVYQSKLLTAVQTERIELEKMNELNRMKTNFFTNIFHEFKTPLTLILGPLEKIRTSGPLKPGLQKQFFIMQHNAKRLLRLTNFLMLSQKNELVGIQLQANETDLVAFIKNIISVFFNRAKEQQISLVFEPPEDALKLWFDREKLEMVFYNLLSNAFKHTHPGGTIEISFMRETVELENAVMQEWVTIDIQDTGRGVAPEKLDKIFDSFYKADKTVPGTGIGLSFSKSIVDLHHGEMSVTSELGEGSCFTVCLLLGDKHLQKEEMIPTAQNLRMDPIYSPQNKRTKASFMDTPIPELSIKNNNKPIILIVEDEYDILAFLRENLLPDYEVVVAFDGQEGLEKANQYDPDLIISDIMMPRMGGIEFCTKIKSNLSTSHIPIIFLTAQSSEEDIFKGLDSGADDFIAKPFNLRVLETKISNIIITRQMLKERFKKELAFGIEEMTITSLDEQFISKVVNLIEENISNPDFNVDSIIGKVNMSRSPFFRKIKAITGQTPSEFLRFFKLKRGAQVLLKSGKTIAQVAYEMGYSSPKIFRAHFKKQFRQTPSEYIKAHTYQKEGIENTN